MGAGEPADSSMRVASKVVGNHLVVQASGEWTDESYYQIVNEAWKEANVNGTDRILLDMRSVSRPQSSITRYLSGVYVSSIMKPRYRIAAIGTPENVTHYGETVARNRGCDFMAFCDEESAVSWLMR